MKYKNKLKIGISAITAATLLIGCGGGGSSSNIANNTMSGQFIDAPVEGLTYECSSGATGTTDSNGGFSCNVNDTVTFKLGDLVLGSVTADSVITPFHLYSNAEDKEKAYNLSQLLHSFDDDNDPDNNIKIDSTLLNSLSLSDLNISTADSNTFENALSTKLAQAGKTPYNRMKANAKMLDFINKNGGSNKYGVDINITEELETLQGLMCSNSEVLRNGECSKETYLTLESIGNGSRALYTYDNNGNMLSLRVDTDEDGVADRIYSYTYDSNNNKLSESSDNDADGTDDTTFSFTYDNNGNKLTQSADTNVDGIADEITTWTYDDNGNILTKSYDGDGDGTPSNSYSYVYDDNDNLLVENYHGNGDDTITAKTIYTYDDNGNMLTRSSDNGADDVIDNIHTYTYDENGNMLTDSEDYQPDGTIDKIKSYTYDSNGNLLTSGTDSDADGIIDEYQTTYTYDNNGNKLTTISDNDLDGIAEWNNSYTYDSNGNMLTSSEVNGAGTINRENSYTLVSLTDYINGNYSITEITLPTNESEEETTGQLEIPSGVNLIKITYNAKKSYEEMMMTVLVNDGAPYSNISTTTTSSETTCTSYGFTQSDLSSEESYYEETEKEYNKNGIMCREVTYNANAEDEYGSETVLTTLTVSE